MKCFKCGKSLPPAFPGSEYRQPSGGLTFTAPGNYGSTIWDPTMSAPKLVIWICDQCIIEHHTLVQMLEIIRAEPKEVWADFGPEHWSYDDADGQ